MNKFLLMWLEGPLQSWGDDSRYGRRESLPFPTKSGIFGLICAAQGAGGVQSEWLEEHQDSLMDVLVYSLSKEDKGTKLLRDFQTVGNGYNDKDPFESLFIPKTSEGKAAVGGGSKITYRYYLQEARYAIILELSNSQCQEIAEALQQPVWHTSLGRKSCTPSEWIYQGIFDTYDDAFSAAKRISESKELYLTYRIKEGKFPDSGRVQVVNDVPLSFGQHKKYAERYITVIPEL